MPTTHTMEKIIWTDDFSVGVRKLDEQHKKIINFLNLLIESPDLSVHSETLNRVLPELLRYSTEHLYYEEKLLKDNNYPDFEDHKRFHVDYIDKISDISIGSMGLDSRAPFELIYYLKHWWENHILREDMKYRAFFQEKGIS